MHHAKRTPSSNRKVNVGKERSVVKVNKGTVKRKHPELGDYMAESEQCDHDNRYKYLAQEGRDSSEFHPLNSNVQKDERTDTHNEEMFDTHQLCEYKGDVSAGNKEATMVKKIEMQRWQLRRAAIQMRNVNQDEVKVGAYAIKLAVEHILKNRRAHEPVCSYECASQKNTVEPPEPLPKHSFTRD